MLSNILEIPQTFSVILSNVYVMHVDSLKHVIFLPNTLIFVFFIDLQQLSEGDEMLRKLSIRTVPAPMPQTERWTVYLNN